MADEVSFVGQRNRLRKGMKPIALKSTKNLVILTDTGTHSDIFGW